MSTNPLSFEEAHARKQLIEYVNRFGIEWLLREISMHLKAIGTSHPKESGQYNYWMSRACLCNSIAGLMKNSEVPSGRVD